MNMREVIAHSEAVRQHSERVREGRKRNAAKRVERVEREQAERARREREIERLSPEDRMVAMLFRLSEARVDRVSAAQELQQTASGRRRSHREIAAIMGLGTSTVSGYFSDPEGARQHPTSYIPTGVRSPGRLVREEAPSPEPFGRRLHLARRRAGMTQVKLAEAVGVPKEQIAAWEHGEDPEGPSPTLWLAITQALGQSV